jgi:hypothetical protein
MLCDVISVVDEFVVRVLCSRSAIRIHDVAGVQVKSYVRSNNSLSGVHSLTCLMHVLPKTLKAPSID